MLLLILFAGCLASCAAQTTSPSSTMGMSTPSAAPFTQPVQTTSFMLTSDSTDNVVAILQTAVQSSRELNETTIGPILSQLANIILMLQPEVGFSLAVKNITRV